MELGGLLEDADGCHNLLDALRCDCREDDPFNSSTALCNVSASLLQSNTLVSVNSKTDADNTLDSPRHCVLTLRGFEGSPQAHQRSWTSRQGPPLTQATPSRWTSCVNTSSMHDSFSSRTTLQIFSTSRLKSNTVDSLNSQTEADKPLNFKKTLSLYARLSGAEGPYVQLRKR